MDSPGRGEGSPTAAAVVVLPLGGEADSAGKAKPARGAGTHAAHATPGEVAAAAAAVAALLGRPSDTAAIDLPHQTPRMRPLLAARDTAQVLAARAIWAVCSGGAGPWLRVALFAVNGLVCGGAYFGRVASGPPSQQAASQQEVCFFLVLASALLAVGAHCIDDMQARVSEDTRRGQGAAWAGSLRLSLSGALSELPLLVAMTLAGGLPAYWMPGMHAGANRFAFFLLVLLATLMATDALAALCCAMLPGALGRQLAGSVLLGDLLLCGFPLPASQLPQAVLRIPAHYTNYITYPMAAWATNQFQDLVVTWDCATPGGAGSEGIPPTSPAPVVGEDYCTVGGSALLASMDLPPLTKWGCLGVLLGFLLVMRVGLAVVVKVKHSTRG